MANKASDRLKMGNLLPSSSSKTTASNEMKFESRSPWVPPPPDNVLTQDPLGNDKLDKTQLLSLLVCSGKQ
jgi:hypothetical protein